MKRAFPPLLQLGAIAATIAISVVAWHQYWRLHPNEAFAFMTGRPLPTGVHITAYTWEINDNLFHISHYWMLAGSPAQLRQFPAAMAPSDEAGTVLYPLHESTEDARDALPDIAHLFGRPRTVDQFVIGYESDAPRNNWYWIFAGESEALYEHN
ncbi:hypothetical protein ASE35_11015 [Lysobacter sp. Root916]|uniref:hypothetical protein n=1 Tax=Lysobacter sp. Root916 TaxID=1736606 RepID=UPI0007089CE3|nr:hypothetical protein [Lysobacter sp. Root916]KRD34245.1 hypothetical protein ASE35_11015 [Lysobacter sp. Root916]